MTIEIHKPELEALILNRLRLGQFQTVEDVLLHALKSAEPIVPHGPETEVNSQAQSGAELVAAMQASPYKEIDLEPARNRMTVRDVSF
jgi:hypothetical protein